LVHLTFSLIPFVTFLKYVASNIAAATAAHASAADTHAAPKALASAAYDVAAVECAVEFHACDADVVACNAMM
jgi:hypothetical protein